MVFRTIGLIVYFVTGLLCAPLVRYAPKHTDHPSKVKDGKLSTVRDIGRFGDF